MSFCKWVFELILITRALNNNHNSVFLYYLFAWASVPQTVLELIIETKMVLNLRQATCFSTNSLQTRIILINWETFKWDKRDYKIEWSRKLCPPCWTRALTRKERYACILVDETHITSTLRCSKQHMGQNIRMPRVPLPWVTISLLGSPF